MAAFENGEPGNDEETGALDLAWQLNAGTEFGYYNFSKEVIARSHAALLESENPGNVFWATDKGYELADTSDSTVSLLEKAESCGTDFTAELAAYRAAYTRQQQLLAETAAAETEAMQALAEQSRIVRLPLNQVGSLNKINKAFSRFEQENERRPSPEELADSLDLPAEKVADTLRVSGRHISVDAPFVEGEDNSLLDVLVNDDSPIADRTLINESLSTEVERALSTLTERERDIIKLFFGINTQEMTLEEIGEKFGLTRERVRQIKEKAIRRLRHSSRSKLLKTYLG